MKRIKSIVILVGLMTLIVVAWGSDVNIPYTFSTGQTISSGQMNQNFSAVQTAVNSKQDKLNTTCASGQALGNITQSGGATCADLTSAPSPVIAVANVCASSTCPGTTSGSLSVVTVRSISITVPGPGTVRVSFNGFAGCVTSATYPQVGLSAQIVLSSTQSPIFNPSDPAVFAAGYTEVDATPPEGKVSTYSLFMARLLHASGAGTFPIYANIRNNQSTAVGCSVLIGNMDALWISD